MSDREYNFIMNKIANNPKLVKIGGGAMLLMFVFLIVCLSMGRAKTKSANAKEDGIETIIESGMSDAIGLFNEAMNAKGKDVAKIHRDHLSELYNKFLSEKEQEHVMYVSSYLYENFNVGTKKPTPADALITYYLYHLMFRANLIEICIYTDYILPQMSDGLFYKINLLVEETMFLESKGQEIEQGAAPEPRPRKVLRTDGFGYDDAPFGPNWYVLTSYDYKRLNNFYESLSAKEKQHLGHVASYICKELGKSIEALTPATELVMYYTYFSALVNGSRDADKHKTSAVPEVSWTLFNRINAELEEIMGNEPEPKDVSKAEKYTKTSRAFPTYKSKKPNYNLLAQDYSGKKVSNARAFCNPRRSFGKV